MDVAGGRDDQRIDFEQRAVALVEQPRQIHEQVRELVDLRAFQTERERDFATLIRLRADERIDRGANDLLRRFFRDLFDFDAAFGRRHEHDAARRTIDHRAEIQFALDVGAAFDIDLADRLAVFVGLDRDQVACRAISSQTPRLLPCVSTSFTPPALPRPPACTWTLTTHLFPPIFFAASTAACGVSTA